MFEFELLTPVGPVVQNVKCTELTIPTVDGEIQVLANHTHILTQLETGLLMAKTESGEKRHFAISAGVCKVLKDKISVLAITAESPDNIDIERAEKAKKLAQETLNNQTRIMSDVDLIKYRRKVERAETRMRVGNLK